MIPLQVRMKGWMRYRDEEVADFSGGNLISICGENGGGKSSIFDAITYALYGKHRLGQRDAEDLITQDEDASWVQFDFEMDGSRWRVHRGRSRGTFAANGRRLPGATTHALYRYDAASETWLQVPNTEAPLTLQSALNGILHMSEAAFTSSFLLQQGAATQFLDAPPAERFRIISSLIGLEAYERLAKQAGENARRERDRVQDIAKSLASLADVSKEAVAMQRAAWQQAQTEVVAAQAALSAAQTRAGDAARFADRSGQIEALTALIEEADLLIGRKAQIEADATTYESLAASVETLQRLQAELDAAARLGSEAEQARTEAQAIDIEALAAALEQARCAALEAGTTVEAAAARLVAAEADERLAHDFLVIAEAVTKARAQSAEKRAEVERLGQDLKGLEAAKAEATSLSLLARAVQPLESYAVSLGRFETLEATGPSAALEQALSQAEALIEGAAAAEAQRVVCEEAWHQARDDHSAAKARLADVTEQLRQREAAADETVCSRCGQPVTEEHRRAEIAELKAQVKASQKLTEACRQRESEAARTNLAAREAVAGLQREADALQRRIVGLQHNVDALTEAGSETQRRREAFEAVAPPELLKGIAKKSAVEVSALLLSLADVPSRESVAAQRYEALLGVEGQFAIVKREAAAAEASMREAEQRAGLSLAKVDGAPAAYEDASACLKSAVQQRDEAAARQAAAVVAVTTSTSALDTARQRRAQLEGLASQKDAEAQGRLSTASAHGERLPAWLQPRAMQDAACLVVELEAAQASLAEAPSLLVLLRQAEHSRAGWDGERRGKLTEVADIPEAHRLPIEEAQSGLSLADHGHTEAMESRDEAMASLARLEERLTLKADFEVKSETAAHRQRLFNRLNRLLGKSGLQGALVTSALDSIKNHANAFLQHLTGGSLVLELHKGAGADELDLRAIDTTCMTEARSVQALSGSQKFRCAVAIAMGIGQYAGGRMRSIVIDEGFGSLDDVGQQQMVDELKSLAENMDKVIVVSHLDTFRDRDNFPYQLHVEKAGTASHLRLVV